MGSPHVTVLSLALAYITLMRPVSCFARSLLMRPMGSHIPEVATVAEVDSLLSVQVLSADHMQESLIFVQMWVYVLHPGDGLHLNEHRGRGPL